MISAFFGLTSTVFAIPTGLFFSFDGKGETTLVRINSSSLDLEKICLVDDVADDISRGKCSIDAAKDRIDKLLQPTSVHPILTLLAFFICSGGIAVFFDCFWTEIVGSFIAGLLVGIMV